MNRITKTFTITATEDVMNRFEKFLGFFHYNGGHSNIFGMYFDGDGSDFMRVSPEPNRGKIVDGYSDLSRISGFGADLEVARENCYDAFLINNDHWYRIENGKKIKYSGNKKYIQNEKREWILVE
jgi:hypothetical protein